MLIMSSLFILRSHPIILITIILTQAIIICLSTWLSFNLRWFSFILFLIFLGGLIVLFIYISRLASNEKFYIKINNLILIAMLIAPIIIFYLTNQLNRTYHHSEIVTIKNIFIELYSKSIFMPTCLTIVFLLLTLIVVVKIRSKYEGPIRNIIFK